jgi:hypothetical protein
MCERMILAVLVRGSSVAEWENQKISVCHEGWQIAPLIAPSLERPRAWTIRVLVAGGLRGRDPLVTVRSTGVSLTGRSRRCCPSGRSTRTVRASMPPPSFGVATINGLGSSRAIGLSWSSTWPWLRK